jgi:hypothetical protein
MIAKFFKFALATAIVGKTITYIAAVDQNDPVAIQQAAVFLAVALYIVIFYQAYRVIRWFTRNLRERKNKIVLLVKIDRVTGEVTVEKAGWVH